MNDYQNISIIDVAIHLGIQVKRNKALCFVHDEKTPSLLFNDKKGVYYCHGCEAKGNVFTLVRTILKLNSKETHDWLNTNYLGGLRSTTNPIKQIINKHPKPKEKNENEYSPDSEVYNWLIQKTHLSNDAKTYLVNGRGFSEEIVNKLKIRDIQNPYDFFHQLEKAWGRERLLKCGLLKKDDTGKIKPIWWDHVIIFPFIDLQGQLIYLQARRMKNDGKAKYLNLKGIRKGIYNLNCLTVMSPGERLIICEGIPDTITMIEKGAKAIGFLGANGFDEEFIPLLLDYSICIIPDTDSAGDGMAQKVAEAFRKNGKSIKIIGLPKNRKDVNEFHKSNSRN